MPTLATGYGKLTLEEFSLGLRPLLSEYFPTLNLVTLVVLREEHKSLIESVVFDTQ